MRGNAYANFVMKNAKQVKKILAIVGVALLGTILLAFLAINATLIIKGAVNKDVPPDIFGTAPLTVVSSSMDGDSPDSFDKGALVFIRILSDDEKQNLRQGDIICFRDNDVFVTHRIVAVNKTDGQTVSFVTMGDANNTSDGTILLENVVGKCEGSIAGLGNFAIFLQTPWGILVFVGIPVVAFIVYDVLRTRAENKKAAAEDEKNQSAEQIRSQEEEIRRLKAMLSQQQSNDANSDVSDSEQNNNSDNLDNLDN